MLTTSSTDTEDTTLSLKFEDDSARAISLHHRTDSAAPSPPITKKKWRQRDEWRTQFVNHVRATVLRHEHATHRLSLHPPPGTVVMAQGAHGRDGGTAARAHALVHHHGDGTDLLFRVDMALTPTIDMDPEHSTTDDARDSGTSDVRLSMLLNGLELASRVDMHAVLRQRHRSALRSASTRACNVRQWAQSRSATPGRGQGQGSGGDGDARHDGTAVARVGQPSQ